MRSEGNSPHPSLRVDDDIYLDIQKQRPDGSGAIWRHDTSGFCEDLIKLQELSLQSNHILAGIRKKNNEIGHYLAVLDKKIDLLAQLVGSIGLGEEITPTHHVNLATDSMRFNQAEPLEAGTPLYLKLVLFPSRLCLHLDARVTGCTPQGEAHLIEVSFNKVGETEHEALIRHLLEKQSAELRREREGG